LLNRLSAHALGELELTTSQIKAIEILIRKTMPDLQAMQMSADVNGSLDIRRVNVRGAGTGDKDA